MEKKNKGANLSCIVEGAKSTTIVIAEDADYKIVEAIILEVPDLLFINGKQVKK
jgi:hypothetical protein